MPRTGITAYDLLVSCPGDVVEYLDIIKECVENFNKTIGVANNSVIEVKHWSTDSYPESGDKPQELLNKQFVRSCDAAVALFWTRFGTPTDKYGSGTEEEIEVMLSSEKQVFMYFLDEPINPSNLNSEQYDKVCAFRKKYESRGIYYVVKDINSFRQQFTNHLTKYFLSIVSGEKESFEKKISPRIIIQNDSLVDLPKATIMTSHFAESKFLYDKRESCLENLKSLQTSFLPPRTNKNSSEIDIPKIFEKVNNNTLSMLEYNQLSLYDTGFSDEIKKVILDFASENHIEIDSRFWNIGDLKEGPSILSAHFGGGKSYEGSEEEKQRYKSIKDLYWSIEEYNEYKEFFISMDEKYYVSLVVTNNGNTFDEDIDIKLIVDDGLVIRPEDIMLPGINIIEEILNYNIIESVFKMKSSDIISPYPDYPPIIPKYSYNIPSPFGKSVDEEYDEQKEQFEEELNRIFCYNYYDKEDSDVISFHISYLKHNTTITFPSVLLFKKIPAEIGYEITSKHMPDIIKGKITIIKESSE